MEGKNEFRGAREDDVRRRFGSDERKKTRMKRALITGASGQDGSYLVELLRENGYEVRALTRKDGDITDPTFIEKVVKEEKLDELYNLASVSTVASPWENPEGTLASTALAPLYFLEAIREYSPSTRFFQASSAEMYGAIAESPQNENTPFRPQNLYGIGKLAAHNLVEAYRKDHNLFAISGILFNHESPRRPEAFVTSKITSTLARIKSGEDIDLTLGNLDAQRDWSFAGDIVRGMWMSLQAEKPDTYVFASGTAHTVRDFVNAAAKALDMHITWEGKGEQEVGKNEKGKTIVRVDPVFFRPVETHIRCGDITRARSVLGWVPEISFNELVAMMATNDQAQITSR